MAEVIALAGFTDERLGACNLRCGVGRLVPARKAVKKLFRELVVSMSGILPVQILNGILSQTIETVDRILFATENSARAESKGALSISPAPAACVLL
jgi:hypothetical protein